MNRNHFRIGTTSYIYPDNIIPNVHRLKTRVKDFELVLFEVKDQNSIPSERDLLELRQISMDYDITYSPHMPLDLDLGCENKTIRKDSINKAIHLINYLSVLDPFCYILHLNISRKQEKKIESWQNRINESLLSIIKKTKIPSSIIAIENLNYPFRYVEQIVSDNNLSICIDIGHLVVAKLDIEEHLERYLDNTVIIHMHGVDNGKDHVSLRHLDENLTEKIFKIFKEKDYRGVVTLEIFSESDFEESMSVLEKYL